MPDLTRKEREKEKQLIDMLKEKRDQGEEGWYISKKTLVRDPSFL